MTKQRQATTIPASEVLAHAFRLLDCRKELDAASLCQSQQAVTTEPVTKKSRTEGDAPPLQSLASTATTLPEMHQEGLELVQQLLCAHRTQLLPSCNEVQRRLVRMMAVYVASPPIVATEAHAAMIGSFCRTMSIFCTVFGASSRSLLTEALELCLEKGTIAGVFGGKRVTESACGSSSSLIDLSDAISAAGSFVPPVLLQKFALLCVSEFQHVGEPNANDNNTDLGGAAEIVLTLLLTCRPVPPSLVALGNRLAQCSSTARPATWSVLQRMRATCRMIVLPQTLPWIYASADSVVTHLPVSVATKAAKHASADGAGPSPHHGNDDLPVNKVETPKHKPVLASRPMHPALQVTSTALAARGTQSPQHSRPSASGSSPRVRAHPSPRTRASPAGRHTSTIAHDDIPDIVL